MVLATHLALATLTAAGAGIPWSRDYVTAFRQAEDRRLPVLAVFLGGDCGRRSQPGEVDSRGRPLHETALTDCERMQQDVWESPQVVAAAGRFVAVLADDSDRTLQVRYQVVLNPSALLIDPWGNEVLRVSGFLEPAKMRKVLEAVPDDFSRLEPAGRALQRDAHDPRALAAAAAFYEQAGLRQVSERLYEQASRVPAAADDADRRRQAAIARGLNLLLMKRGADAARVFEAALAEDPRGAQADVLLLGLVNAHLTAGRKKQAETAYDRMTREFPHSPYTRKAGENLQGAAR